MYHRAPWSAPTHWRRLWSSEFKGLIPMLTGWQEEILSYFEFGLTNGFVEGKDTRTKAIIRQA